MQRGKEGNTAPNGLSELKEGSNAPLHLNDGVPDGDGFVDGDSFVDGDGVSDGQDGDDDVPSVGVRRSSRQQNSPDRLTYQQLGGVACHLAYAFISKPTTILAAFYQRFQTLNFDSSTDTIEEELPFCFDDAGKQKR